MSIPVVDLFAGPGGLGEGFSSFLNAHGRHRFKIALSIEKDRWAQATLQLRALRRLLGEVPPAFEDTLDESAPLERLRDVYPREFERSAAEAVLLELGATEAAKVKSLVSSRIDYERPWVLVGGPPCQAYSLIGRARNKGNEDYRPEADHRQKLYVEYLQVLADHAPPVFVMENVKGLLSAQLGGERLFQRIREDLEDPASALSREGRTSTRRKPRYVIRSLVSPDSLFAESQPGDFVVRSEDLGIPQTRHRVILLGVREDLSDRVVRRLDLNQKRRTVGRTIGDLPRLRSGLNEADGDTARAWANMIGRATAKPWYRHVDQAVQDFIRSSLESLRLPKANRGSDRVLRRSNGRTPVYNHRTRSHIPADLDRYLFSSSFAAVHGRSPVLSEFPKLLLPDHESAHVAGKAHFADRFRVQVSNRPSSTITSHISKDGHYYIHHDPSQCRSLTVREAARLQTFPDDYFFCGPRTAQYQQVGNAVPPALARQIAEVVAAVVD